MIYRTGLKRRYIEKWVNRYRSTGTVDDSPRSGRPRVLNPPQVAKLAKAVEQRNSVPAAVAALKKKGLIPRWVSIRTARRAIKRLLQHKKQRVRPVLTAKTRQKRLAFCKERHPVTRVVAVDSTILTAGGFGSRRKVWCKRGTTPVVHKYRKGQKVHVYGGITHFGRTKLVRVTGTTGLAPRFTKPGGVEKYRGVCAKEFQQVMQKHLVPQAKRIMRAHNQGPPVFLLDGAPVHTAAATRNFMSARHIECLQGWPPNSPDLNPIENAWGWLKWQVDRELPGTGAEVWRVAQRKWRKLTPAKCRKYMRSFGRRMRKCCRLNGGDTNY